MDKLNPNSVFSEHPLPSYKYHLIKYHSTKLYTRHATHLGTLSPHQPLFTISPMDNYSAYHRPAKQPHLARLITLSFHLHTCTFLPVGCGELRPCYSLPLSPSSSFSNQQPLQFCTHHHHHHHYEASSRSWWAKTKRENKSVSARPSTSTCKTSC